MTAPHPYAEILKAVADGKQIQWRNLSHHWTDQGPSTTLFELGRGTYPPENYRVKPDLVQRFIPVLRMSAGTIVMTEARTERRYAVDDEYNERGPSEKQVGVLHVQIDPETLELVSASMEKL